MVNKVAGILTLVVAGVIIATLVIHPQGTGTLFNSLGKTWTGSLAAILGK